MPIVATPEVGIPFPFDTTPEELEDFRAKAHAYFKTIKELEENGLEVEVTDADRIESHRIMASQTLPPPREILPGAIANLEALLTEWDQEVLDVHRRLRNYVTNKLIVESNDPDPKIRLKALELLGKTSNVGLFSERVDINVTHRTVADIEAELRKTLELYTDYTEVEDSSGPKTIADLDLDAELGEMPEDTDESDAAE
jgi:hypothetical protein